jgi:membrane-associated phospholipid phosphatase
MWMSKAILDWGVEIIRWLQQFSPALDLPFNSLTFLGNLEFFLLFLPFLYWCINRCTGARLLVLFLFSAYINSIAKAVMAQPRPFEYDTGIVSLVHAGGGGLPSGHTQNAVVVWGYIAAQVRNKKAWILAAFLMVAIPLSRLYLGVHFPTDLLGGYFIGAVLLILYVRIAPKVESWLAQRTLRWQLSLAIGVPIGLILLIPEGARYALSAAGVLLGSAPGLILERRWVGFCSAGRPGKKILRFAAGLVVLIALWAGLKAAFAGLAPEAVLRVLRYALIGLWCALGAPWLFVRLKLAETDQKSDLHRSAAAVNLTTKARNQENTKK